MSSPPPSSAQFLFWENVVAVIDDGRARQHHYSILQGLVTAQAARYPEGLGCLVIIPKNATPPPDEARKALNLTLESLAGSLRCMCWLVEGSGFQGAMVRAVLTGLRFVANRSYATHVSTSMDEALGWILTRLPGSRGSADVVSAKDELTRQRRDGEQRLTIPHHP